MLDGTWSVSSTTGEKDQSPSSDISSKINLTFISRNIAQTEKDKQYRNCYIYIYIYWQLVMIIFTWMRNFTSETFLRCGTDTKLYQRNPLNTFFIFEYSNIMIHIHDFSLQNGNAINAGFYAIKTLKTTCSKVHNRFANRCQINFSLQQFCVLAFCLRGTRCCSKLLISVAGLTPSLAMSGRD